MNHTYYQPDDCEYGVCSPLTLRRFLAFSSLDVLVKLPLVLGLLTLGIS